MPISLGRGTGKPFQQFGRPLFPAGTYTFTPESMPGATRPSLMSRLCNGFDLSGINVGKDTGNRRSLNWVLKAYSLFPDNAHFFNGNGSREGLSGEEIRKSWDPAPGDFIRIRKKYLLYADP